MQDLQISFPLKDLPLKPEITGRVKVDETLIQALSALMGYDGEGRRLLKCALSGSLRITSPIVKGISNKVTSGEEHNITFSDVLTTEVLVIANPDNSSRVWLNLGIDAGVDIGWPLDAGDFLNISINNLQRLRLYTASIGDKVIVLWTV